MEKQNQVSQELRGWSPPRRTDSIEPKCLGSNPGSAIDYLCDLGKLLTSLGLSFSICKMGLTKQGDRHIVFRAVPDSVVLVVPSQSTSHPCYIRTGLVQRKEKGANLGVPRRHSKKEVSLNPTEEKVRTASSGVTVDGFLQVRAQAPWSHRLAFKFQHLLTTSPLARHFTSLHLIVCICKMGPVIPFTSQGYGEIT